MRVAVTHPALSAHEFEVLFTDIAAPVELVEGEVIVSPPAGWPSANAHSNLLHLLMGWSRASPGRGYVVADAWTRIDEANTYGPDVSWYAADRRPTPDGRRVLTTVPDLVAEVLSPTTRANDLGPKRDVYDRAGVRELWLVDPEAETVAVLRRDATATLRESAHLGASDRLTSSLLDGFDLDVAEVFRF